MKRLQIIIFTLLLGMTSYAQQFDLIDIHPEDSTIRAAKEYSDSVENKIETISKWGIGDKRFSFATMQLDLSFGHQQDHLMGEGEFYNYGLGISYTPFQFSTYKAQRPCFFGGGLTFGIHGMMQPEDGYMYTIKSEEREIIRPMWGDTVIGIVSVMYDLRNYKQTIERFNFTIGLPLAFTAKIGNSEAHQVSLGIEPEIGLGAWEIKYETPRHTKFSWTWTLRAIMQYRYKNLFVNFRPAISVESFTMDGGDRKNPHAKLGIGWNF